MPQLVFCAKHFLLTYAHCEGRDGKPELDPHRVVEIVGNLGAECIVSKEDYPSREGFHYHVFCSFERRFRSRRADVFDVDGYHPNVLPSRGNEASGFDYATKEGNIVAGGLERPSGEGGRARTAGAKDEWAVITAAETVEELWELVEELDPKSMVLHFPAVQKFAEWKFRPLPVPYSGPDGVFDIAEYPALGEWRDSVFESEGGGESYTYGGGPPRGTPPPFGGSPPMGTTHLPPPVRVESF